MAVAALPEVTREILALMDDPQTTAGELAHAIAQDPAVSARLLKVANSDLYGFSGQIDTVGRAIVLLGLGAVQSLALSVSVGPLFEEPSSPTDFDPRALWRHSVAVGLVARALLMPLDRPGIERALLVGILHDVGLLLECRHRPEAFSRAVQAFRAEGGQLVDYERTFLHTDHAELAAAVARRWRFPGRITDAIQWHHAEASRFHQADNPLALAVALADLIVAAQGLGYNDQSLASSRLESLLSLWPLDVPDPVAFGARVLDELPRNLSRLSPRPFPRVAS